MISPKKHPIAPIFAVFALILLPKVTPFTPERTLFAAGPNTPASYIDALTSAFVSQFSKNIPSPEEAARIAAAIPEKPPVEPRKPRKLLILDLSRGFRHSSIEYWNTALTTMADKTGAFAATVTGDLNSLQTNNLQQYDALCLNNNTRLETTPELRKSLLDFLHSGRGIIAIHAAVDSFYDWPEMAQIIGAQFTSHPWTAPGTWAIRIDDPDHKLMQPFEGKGFKISDEIYRTAPPFYSRSRQRVLMSLDMSDPATRNAPGVVPADADTGISWVKTVGEGRVFYGSLGHNHHITWNPTILEHYLLGIQFALGDLEVETDPIPAPETKEYTELLTPLQDYDYGQSRLALTAIEDRIRELDAPGRQALANAMADMLDDDISLAAKDFLCRKLSEIGSETHVPQLANLLLDEATSHYARHALERIPGRAPDLALLAGLENADGLVKIGIVNSLGQRRKAGPEKELGALLTGRDQELAVAAAVALGYIGTDQAAAELTQALARLQLMSFSYIPERIDALDHALVTCADRLAESGNTENARALYTRLYDSGLSSALVRLGALRGLVETSSGGERDQLIVAAIGAEDSTLRAGALAMARRLGPAGAEAAAGRFGGLDPLSQIQLLSALTDRGQAEPAVTEAVLEGAQSEDEAVRIAALQALSRLGGPEQVILLAQRAATAGGEESRAAHEALAGMQGEKVDAEIVRLVGENLDNAVKIQLIRAIGARQMTSGAALGPVVIAAARDGDRRVRREAYRVLNDVAPKAYSHFLIELVLRPAEAADRQVAEATLVTVSHRADPELETQSVVDMILKGMELAEDATARAALVRVLGTFPGEQSLSQLRAALASDEPEVREAAVQALGQWPTTEPRADLLAVVRGASDGRLKTLAWRGMVRLIGLENGVGDAEKAVLYGEALELAPNANEKKGVLAGLGQLESVEALELAAGQLDDAAVAQEAAVAVLAIAEHTAAAAPEVTRAAVERAVLKSQK